MEWGKAGDSASGTADWSFNPESLFVASAVAGGDSREVRRAETAPSIMTEVSVAPHAMFDEEIPESEAYRCTPQYHMLYYSQMPRDPRMPHPIKRRQAAPPSNPMGVSTTTANSTSSVSSTNTAWSPTAQLVGKSSLTGDIVSLPRSHGSQQPHVPGRVVTPSTAQQLFSDPNAQLPHGARVVYVTEPPKAITPSTIYVLLPAGSPPPPGATIIHAPPSFGVEPNRVGSGSTHLVSANGQILVAPAPSPPNQFGVPVKMMPHNNRVSVTVGSVASQPRGQAQGAAPTAAPGARHPLVQQYIDTRTTADWNTRLIVGHIGSFSRDQDGSRFIQRQLDYQENVALVWNETYPIASELMCDVFGNYVIQKIFDVADEERRIKLVALFKGIVMKLAMQTYGCRVLQKAFDLVPPQHLTFVAEELRGNVGRCVLDQNANHVIQKCIEKLASYSQFVADEFLQDLIRLSCHAYGCRVMQKLFEACYYDEARVPSNPYAPTNLTVLYNTVFDHLDDLVLNQYGNYVVQHGMMNCTSTLQRKFIDKIVPRVFELSKSKFGSNVAEKAVELATEQQRSDIIQSLIADNNDDTNIQEPPLVSMMRDAFANYVVQRLMDRSTPAQQAEMVRVVLPHVMVIAQATFGKHLLNRMDKLGLLPPHIAALVVTGGGNDRKEGGQGSRNQPAHHSGGGNNSGGRGRGRNGGVGERGGSGSGRGRGSNHNNNGRGEDRVSPKEASLHAPAARHAPSSRNKGVHDPPVAMHQGRRPGDPLAGTSGTNSGANSATTTPTSTPNTFSLTPNSSMTGFPSTVKVTQHMPYRSPSSATVQVPTGASYLALDDPAGNQFQPERPVQSHNHQAAPGPFDPPRGHAFNEPSLNGNQPYHPNPSYPAYFSQQPQTGFHPPQPSSYAPPTQNYHQDRSAPQHSNFRPPNEHQMFGGLTGPNYAPHQHQNHHQHQPYMGPPERQPFNMPASNNGGGYIQQPNSNRSSGYY